jgi:hypothetical protein
MRSDGLQQMNAVVVVVVVTRFGQVDQCVVTSPRLTQTARRLIFFYCISRKSGHNTAVGAHNSMLPHGCQFYITLYQRSDGVKKEQP